MTAQNDTPSLQTALAQGQELERNRAFAAAMAHYQALLPLHPRAGALHFGLGRCARALGDHQTALRHFEAALEIDPGSRPRRFDVAQSLFALGDTGAAQAHYQALAGTKPDDAAAQAGLGRCARKSGALEEALGHFQNASRLQPDDPRHQSEAADVLRALSRLDEAAALYHAVVKRQPSNHAAHSALGYIARRQGQRRAAAQHFAQAAALQPKNPQPKLEAATEQRAIRQFAAARDYANAALSLAPGSLPALLNLAETELAAGQHEAALDLLQQGLDWAPDDSGLLRKAAQCLRALHRLDEAQAMYQRAIAAQPDGAWAYLGLGQTQKRLGQMEAAEASFAQATKLAPDDHGLLLDLASEQRELGHFDTARKLARDVSDAARDNIRALLNLAETERAAGGHEAALRWFSAAHARRPGDPDILVKMAIQERQLGRQDECNAHLTAALELDALNVPALRAMAEQFTRADDTDSALELLDDAISQMPDEMALWTQKLETLIAANMIPEALELADTLETRAGLLPVLLIKRSFILRRTGENERAVTLSRQGVQLYPHHFPTWLECFQAELFMSGDEALDALLACAPAVTPAELARLERCRGLLAERRWQYDLATEYFHAAQALDPNSPGLYQDIARVALVRLDLPTAKTCLTQHRAQEAVNLRLRGKSLNVSQSLFGQLLDEYLLNETPPRIQPLLTLPLEERIAALTSVTTDEPDNTAAAASLLVALRAAGRLGHVAHEAGSAIPKLIFQYWDTPDIPEDIAAFQASWGAKNPDYGVHLFDDAKALAFLKTSYPAPVAQAYQHAREPAQKADLFRLALLYAYGGVYADGDDCCQHPLGALLPDDASLVLYQEDLGTIGNNFIATMPRHPLILKALQMAVQALNRGDSDIVWLSTGPGMISRAFIQCYVQGGEGLPGHSYVIGRQHLFPVIAVGCASGYKRTRKHWSNSTFASKRDALRRVLMPQQKSAG